MKNLFETLTEIYSILFEMPDKEFDGLLLTVTEGNDEDDFDDRRFKELINTFKEGVEELDDDLSVEAFEDMAKYMNLSEFDKLLSADKLTREEAERVEEMIETASKIILNKLEEKIQSLEELEDVFCI